jgi:DNA-binding cell septation regulator SpoVG
MNLIRVFQLKRRIKMSNTPEIKVVRMYPLNKEGQAVKAFADITINGAFQVRNLKVCQSTKKGNGLFVSFPSEIGEGKEGKQWFEIVKPITKEAREEVSKAVLGAYKEKAKEQAQ